MSEERVIFSSTVRGGGEIIDPVQNQFETEYLRREWFARQREYNDDTAMARRMRRSVDHKIDSKVNSIYIFSFSCDFNE